MGCACSRCINTEFGHDFLEHTQNSMRQNGNSRLPDLQLAKFGTRQALAVFILGMPHSQGTGSVSCVHQKYPPRYAACEVTRKIRTARRVDVDQVAMAHCAQSGIKAPTESDHSRLICRRVFGVHDLTRTGPAVLCSRGHRHGWRLPYIPIGTEIS